MYSYGVGRMESVNIGQRVRELREQQGLTQQQLAEKIGVNLSTLAKIEAGRNDASLATAVAIAKALQTTVDDLVRPVKQERRPRGRPRKRPENG